MSAGSAASSPAELAHDHRGRLARLQAALPDLGCDAFLVTRPVHVRWLTSFTGSNGTLAVHADRVVLLTDGRYRDQVAAQLEEAGFAADIEVVVENVATKEVTQAAVAGAARLGLEASSITWAQQRRFATDWFPGVDLVATEGVLEAWRAIKEPSEVARIEAGCDIADAALAAVLPRLHDGSTEAEFALALETAMRERGASGPSFETIVASGPNAALPHARPTARRIERGDLVVLDFGALVDGYHSDMTRTVCVGPPNREQQRLWDVVFAAQAAGRALVGPGVATQAIDAACRDHITAEGLGELFTHGTGHGVGLEIHEAPAVSRQSPGTIEIGHVVTVEPGCYLPGVGGVRIEDTVVATADGCRSLTKFPKVLTT